MGMMYFSMEYIPLTLTSHSSILWVATWTADKGAVWAVSEVTFSASAVHIVQVDWTSTSIKVSSNKGYSTCWYKEFPE